MSIRTKLKSAWELRRGDDRGVVAGADALIFGAIALVVSSFLIINVWAVIDTALATAAASREAARVYVESDPGDAVSNSQQRANAVMDAYGKTNPVTVTGSTNFARCAVVTVNVSYDINLIDLPLFGSFGATTIERSHSERVDAFRSGDFKGECEVL